MDNLLTRFQRMALDASHHVLVGQLPAGLLPDEVVFEVLWNLHPREPKFIVAPGGGKVPLPRYQQAYGRDYRFSGTVSEARPLPRAFQKYMDWCRATVHSGFNGVLTNWYDADLGHYIGPHRDKATALVEASPIVTVSLGASRIFRLSRRDTPRVDLDVHNGTVVVIPWKTNQVWKHAIPKSKRARGRRISMTARVFAEAPAGNAVP